LAPGTICTAPPPTGSSLIENQRYSAVLIEGSRKKFEVLQGCYAGRPNIITKNLFVGWSAPDGLDAILEKTPVPADFDFLSVDIDGNDYHAWNAIVKYRPKIMIVEFNPTIPPEVHFVQPTDPAINWGSSLAALVGLGKKRIRIDWRGWGQRVFCREKIFPALRDCRQQPASLVDQTRLRDLPFLRI
jgi:hypothetical protein